MQVDAFRYFIELARAGSFNKAAQRSFITQQGLNKAISTLEDELGMKLVERSTPASSSPLPASCSSGMRRPSSTTTRTWWMPCTS